MERFIKIMGWEAERQNKENNAKNKGKKGEHNFR